MNNPTLLIKQHALPIFCALTFAATLLPLPGEGIAVVMVFIPALMAISLTALSEGKVGVRSLLGKLAQWRSSFKWVLIAVALGFVMRLLVSLIAVGLGMITSIQLRSGGPASFVYWRSYFLSSPFRRSWVGAVMPCPN